MKQLIMRVNNRVPLRYSFWVVTLVLFAASVWMAWESGSSLWWTLVAVSGWLAATGFRDLLQTPKAVLRNYPVIGHLRYLLEFIRPEIRQYFIESDSEAAPFSRQQRSLVYQRAKGAPDQRPFGTQRDVRSEGYEWLSHSVVPSNIDTQDFRVRIGGDGSSCTKPYHASLFNISAMSFGSLSANAILALNKGAAKGGFAHDTGEGSISQYHREGGGDLIWEIGSGYFGCRDTQGNFDEARFMENAREPQVKMIEIKVSQGAKPGHGGVLPGPKVTPEIAQARGVPMGVDCISPASHSAFSTPLEMMHFIERLRQLSGGKPVGFKLCIGHPWEWFAMVKAMQTTQLWPDFIVVDGAEGGTGAAPLEFTDHIGAPLQEGLLLVHNTLVGVGQRHRVKLGCAGKVVSAFDMVRMRALGADWCNSARGFMFSLGCIQAQTCHTGHCPSGVATQDPVRQRALVVSDKAERVYRYHHNTMHALKEMTQAAGLAHPHDITADHIVRRGSGQVVHRLSNLLTFAKPGQILAAEKGEDMWPQAVFEQYWTRAQADSFALSA
jgi:glutamate synthase domain-containing protein 2